VGARQPQQASSKMTSWPAGCQSKRRLLARNGPEVSVLTVATRMRMWTPKGYSGVRPVVIPNELLYLIELARACPLHTIGKRFC